MNIPEFNRETAGFWIFFSFFWIGWGILGLILAWSGFFYGWAFIAYGFFGFALVCKYAIANKILPSKSFLFIVAVLLSVSILYNWKTTPTIFSGRDQGSISEAAIRLADNHQLSFSTPASQEFFKIYGPGKALNFPGFHYQNDGTLVTQFPIAYIAWLGSFYALFGLIGFQISNSILLAFFSVSFFLVASSIFKSKLFPYLATMLLLISSSVAFFTRFSLSENLAAPLLWTMILSLIYFLKEPNKLFFGGFLISALLLLFTRIEGFAFFLMSIVLLISQKQKLKNFAKQNIKEIIGFCLITIIAILFDLLSHPQFYKEVAKGFLGFLSSGNQVYKPETYSQNFIYFSSIYFAYGLLVYFLLGFLGIILSIRMRVLSIIVPLIITLPTFIYLVDPRISSDHPWMLRRFLFAILPVFILYSAYFLERISKKSIFGLVAGVAMLLLVMENNFHSLQHFIRYSENENLLSETNTLSENFSEKDLVLIDRKASGNGWSMISGPMSFLHGKNSVYFFNTDDYGKIDQSKFEHIYLIASEEKLDVYQNSTMAASLKIEKKYVISTNQLNLEQSKTPVLSYNFPSKDDTAVTGTIFKLK